MYDRRRSRITTYKNVPSASVPRPCPTVIASITGNGVGCSIYHTINASASNVTTAAIWRSRISDLLPSSASLPC